jgi:hypothetical protein
MGDACSAEYEDGRQITVEARPDPGFERSAFLQDCAQPVLMMTAARACGATFVEKGRGATGPRAEGPRRAPPTTGSKPEAPIAPPPVIPPAELPKVPVVTGGGEVKPVMTPDEYAKTIGVPTLLKQYCQAQESRDLQKVAEIHPSADLVERKRTFNQ